VVTGAIHVAAACFRLATADGMTMMSTTAISSSSHLHGCHLQERLRAAHSLQQQSIQKDERMSAIQSTATTRKHLLAWCKMLHGA
jgi:hypothetical protein